MAPSDKNDILHAIDAQATILSDLHTVVDIID
jgi:hypothetical protein